MKLQWDNGYKRIAGQQSWRWYNVVAWLSSRSPPAPCSCSHSLMVQKDPFRNAAMPALLWGLDLNWFISLLCFCRTCRLHGSMIVWTNSCPTDCRSFHSFHLHVRTSKPCLQLECATDVLSGFFWLYDPGCSCVLDYYIILCNTQNPIFIPSTRFPWR